MFTLFVLTCFDFLHQNFVCYFLFLYEDAIFIPVSALVLDYVYYPIVTPPSHFKVR
jgi:hypothetical protein